MRTAKFGRSITIDDVAREAGVGLGTVSRVLNDHPSVRPATREKVLAAIKKLGYQPNAQARRLARGSTDTICFLLSNRSFSHSFHARILQGVEAHCSSTGHQVVYTSFTYGAHTPPSKLALPRIIAAPGVVDGVIVSGTNYPNLLAALDRVGMRYVVFGNNLVGNEPEPTDTVLFDDEDGAYKATCHLLEQGHSRIAFVGDTTFPWFRRRYAGYSRAMNEAGLTPQQLHSIGDMSVEYGLAAARAMLSSGHKITALVAGNDMIAYGIWRGLRLAELSVPDDVSIIGFDDREEALLMEPPLTTVRVYKEEIGVECARLLLEKIRLGKPSIESVRLTTELVVRGSVAPPGGRVADSSTTRIATTE